MEPTFATLAVRVPILVNSVSKAGTYLVGKLLENAGIAATGYHLRRDRYWNWNLAETLDDIIKAPQRFLQMAALDEALVHIGPGYTLAHLNHRPDILAVLARVRDLRHVFLYRNLRDALISQMRFVAKRESINGMPDREDHPDPERFVAYLGQSGKSYVHNAAKQLGWLQDEAAVKFRFEDIVAGQEETIVRLLDTCGVDGARLADVVYARSIAARTRTSSGRLTCWEDYWSLQAEDLFTEIGAKSLNLVLGYEAEAT